MKAKTNGIDTYYELHGKEGAPWLVFSHSLACSVRMWDRSVDPTEQNDVFDPNDPKALELWADLKPQVEAMAPLVVDGLPSPIWPADLP